MSALPATPSGATGAHLGPLGSLLERFRRTSGVPAAASEDTEAELLPVFAALAGVEAEAGALIAAARREAEQRSAAAERAAARIIDDAERHGALERLRTENDARARAADEAGAVAAAARAVAEAELVRGRARIAAVAREVVADLLEERS
ncbi:MAG: hypothetical protein ACXVRJ_08655 [Gaiellaceae bacterium]